MIKPLLATAFLTASLAAHGGQYRGPGNVVPPPGGVFRGPGDVSGAGGAGGTTGPTGSAGSSGAGQSLVPRGGSGAAGAVGRGTPVGDDLGRWEFWWEFGKDPYLRLRDSIYRQKAGDPGQALWNPRLASGKRDIKRPAPADVRQVASQLRALLAESKDRDLTSACLIALAKIGSKRAGFEMAPLFLPFLKRGDQELRETAAIAFGITGDLDRDSIAILHDLVADTSEGRRLSDKGAINERTRAFAAYASGLLLRRSRKAAASMRLTQSLQGILQNSGKLGRNLTVAAIEALALFPKDWTSKAANSLRSSIVAELGVYYDRKLGAGDQLIQAHVPTAIATLLLGDSLLAAKWRDRFAADLRTGLRKHSAGAGSKVNHHVAQSCALALGSLCAPWQDENSQSHAIGLLLSEVQQGHRDQQTRSFATLALARMGGDRAIACLLDQLSGANKAIEQPWLAVALGVVVARHRQDGSHLGSHAATFATVTKSLLQQFETARNPSTVGSIAIALGLTGTAEARDSLRRRLVAHKKRDLVAGYVALALGLLQDSRAVVDLRELRRGATRRPFVLLQSVRALGLLGDHQLTAELSSELQQPGQSLVRLSATAAALGQIGDRRCLPALQALLLDDQVAPLTHAFAVVALGGVCDKDPLPWNAVYATQVNYRASTETLTDGISGILDLL